MIRKKIWNSLLVSLMITLIPASAHAGWFSFISDYFNKPSKNALVGTTLIGGISFVTAVTAVCYYYSLSKIVKSLLNDNDALRYQLNNYETDSSSDSDNDSSSSSDSDSEKGNCSLASTPRAPARALALSTAYQPTGFANAHDAASPVLTARPVAIIPVVGLRVAEEGGFGSAFLGHAKD